MKKFNIPESQRVTIEKATLKMSAGLACYLFTEVVSRLAKKNLNYGAAMHYIQERVDHLPSQELIKMWASWYDKNAASKLFKSIWMTAKAIHDGKLKEETVFEYINSTHHMFNLSELLKAR